jgi:uracil-DNA glycosylase family 4
MSPFTAALEIVLGRLDERRASGAAAWPASRASLARLLEEPAPQAPAAPGPGGAYQTVTDPALPKAERLARLRACPERLPCPRCPYGRGAHPHIVFGVGNIDAELMFVGEAPGAEEDARGEPFVGRAGQLLNRMIATMGYERSHVYIANILKCRPDTPGQTAGNRAPTNAEMESCRPCLYEQIEIIRPKAIVALGATAMRGLLDAAEPIGKLRGRWHDFRGTPVMATYHPSYLLHNQAPAERRKVWEDLLEVKARLGHPITDRDRSYFLTRS